MGQFKPMVKMMTTEPTVELKLKKGGAVFKKGGKVKKYDDGGTVETTANTATGTTGTTGTTGSTTGTATGGTTNTSSSGVTGKPDMVARRAAMKATQQKARMAAQAAHEKEKMADRAAREKEHMARRAASQAEQNEKMKARGRTMPTTSSSSAAAGSSNASSGTSNTGAKMKKGGKVHDDAAQDRAMIKKALAGKKFKTGGVVNGQGGYKTGGVIKGQGGYKTGGVIKGQGGYADGGDVLESSIGDYLTPLPPVIRDPGYGTGRLSVRRGKQPIMYPGKGGGKGNMGNPRRPLPVPYDVPVTTRTPTVGSTLPPEAYMAKGGKAKKPVDGQRVQDDGRPVKMPQGSKRPMPPVSITALSGTYKKGGDVKRKYGKGGDVTEDEAKHASAAESQGYKKYYEDERRENEETRRQFMNALSHPFETLQKLPKKLAEGFDAIRGKGSVTKTEREKSVTVTPGKKRGGRAC